MENHGQRLSRRERQIMDVLYRRGRATAGEIQAEIADPPSYSAVRALLRILEHKGEVRHVEEGTRYVHEPVVAKDRARKSALKHLLETFFQGSPKDVVATLLDVSAERLDAEQLDALERMIDDARKAGR